MAMCIFLSTWEEGQEGKKGEGDTQIERVRTMLLCNARAMLSYSYPSAKTLCSVGIELSTTAVAQIRGRSGTESIYALGHRSVRRWHPQWLDMNVNFWMRQESMDLSLEKDLAPEIKPKNRCLEVDTMKAG